MMGTAFLGYVHSPKWFNISISLSGELEAAILSFLIIVYYITQNLGFYKKRDSRFQAGVLSTSLRRKSKVLIHPTGNTKNIKYNKLNNKSIYLLNNLSKNRYSTIPSFNKSIETCSERLNTIIEELGLNPVYIFENLDTEASRKGILNDTKGLSGIYMIVNKITKDYYIGSAATNRFYARFSNHLIYFKGSKIVKLAVKKYELKNFAFIILELYPNIVTKENNKELLDLEDGYLKLLLPNYNILTEAGSSFGYKHTEVDRQKMKDFYSEERRERIGTLNRGKKLSFETIEKIREKALNRPPMSDETKQKCITHTRPVVLYNLNGTVYGEYSSILDAAKSINCNEKTVRRALKTEKGLVKKQ
jgi:group I intron endonuclease